MNSIDLNCDLGEGFSNDTLLYPYISSANIACGYHAGDLDCITKAIDLCIANNVAIGAHPGFNDKENFGRKEIQLSAERLQDLVMHEILVVRFSAMKMGQKLHHVKLHGAMYNMAARDKAMALTIADAIYRVDPELMVYGLSGSYIISEAKALGLPTCSEVFADRTYQSDGSLTPRNEPRALIINSEIAIKQVVQMIEQQTVTCVDGTIIPIIAETVCLHGDGNHAVNFAKQINETLKQHHIDIKAQ
ncbi:MAG: LamB/YcsF family protein [Deinococcales bacterium]|nr:LamB/YcsF family protein [Chitinophagaceae bacterium]